MLKLDLKKIQKYKLLDRLQKEFFKKYNKLQKIATWLFHFKVLLIPKFGALSI